MYEKSREREKSRTFPFSFLLLYVAFAGSALYLLRTSDYNDYYTFCGFHLQKTALGSLLLFVAIFVVLVRSNFTVKTKVGKVVSRIAIAGYLLLLALPISTMLKFNRRVNSGILIERHGGTTPLMAAAYKGDLPEIKRLVKSGANVNVRNDVNNTALHFAAGATPIRNQIYIGDPSAVAYLIGQGADVNAQNNTGITPLMDAVINNNLESIKILVAHGADVNKVSKYNETALSMAVIRRYRDIAFELIRHGADPNFKDFTGRTPIQTAEKYHEAGLVKELKDHGAHG